MVNPNTVSWLNTPPRRSGEIAVVSVGGKVSYHPIETKVYGSKGLMKGRIELVAKDEYFEYYVDEEGLLKDLPLNYFVTFGRIRRGFPSGKVICYPWKIRV